MRNIRRKPFGRVGKTIFTGIMGFAGYTIGFLTIGTVQSVVIGAIWGVVAALVIFLLEFGCRKLSSRTLLGVIIGGLSGFAIASVLIHSFFIFFTTPLAQYLRSSLTGIGVLAGIMVGVNRIQLFEFGSFRQAFSEKSSLKNYKILDTSVIIDGRIADISETGFLEGVLVIPQFILQELQHIADSADSIKRNRGRRGLEILHKIQKRVDMQVEILEQDFSEIPEIDAKLVELAKLLHAKLITNDFNLNKVAELQGVSVLNVNELANALKPVLLPGEEIEALILKEGKEYGQGIAYLDDGTMIVIDHARKLIGKTVSVSVTSVLQTTAGRMIFGQLAGKDTYK
ncbi:PIN domain nuclease [candidate division KSB3 bacterium]|uniref:PIN domain nuclease n=1 Tax=candidate division KSB3 bacterium TaxID=2044937 RepID=A0A2G6KK55_9BACT|nr:MAG: PIN domain nuclease [candidate division KSB3 bacterium]